MATDHLLLYRDQAAGELTIDELARLTGTTVRNIRSHQTRGMLPPPTIRGRTGYYGPEHAERVQMIQAMQAEGFRLEAIKRLLDRPEGAAKQIFEFGRNLLDSFGDAAPEFATSSELAARFGGPLDPGLLRKAQKLGLLRRVGNEDWEIRNPTLVSAGEQLVAIGIPLAHALAVAEKIERHTRAIARAYLRLFLNDVLGGEEIVTRSADEWSRIHDALERLRPLAVEALRSSFEHAMVDQIESQVRKAMDG